MGSVSRRGFLRTIGALAGVLAPGVFGQPAGRVRTIGVLANHARRAELEMGAASPFGGTRGFLEVLHARGWVHGKNLSIVWRSAEGRMDRHAALASELARMPVDVIVGGDDAIRAAMQATRSIPVVAYSVYDPIENGYAQSLARPGGNLTGLLAAPSGQGHLQKALALLKEIAPRTRSVALVAQARERADRFPEIRPGEPMEVAARALGLEIFFVTFGDPATIPELVRSAARQGANALMVDSNYAIHYHPEIREALAAEATRLRLPVLHLSLVAAADGALMSVGVDLEARWRRAAYFVDRILRGEKPGAIPMEHAPSNVELHVNRKAARAIGLEIPPTVLLQAQRVFD